MTQYVDTKIRANLTYLGDLEALRNYAARLESASREATQIVQGWRTAPDTMRYHRNNGMCSFLTAGAPSVTPAEHATLPYDALYGQCLTHADQFTMLATTLHGVSDSLVKAYSLYSQAEQTARRVVNEILEAGIALSPTTALYGLAAVPLLTPIIGLARHGEFTPVSYTNETAWISDGIVAGFTSALTGAAISTSLGKLFTTLGKSKAKLPKNIDWEKYLDPTNLKKLDLAQVFKNLFAADESNAAFHKAATLTAPLTSMVHGEGLDVYAITPHAALPKPESIAQAYANVDALTADSTSPGYATVCIQKLADANGKRSWIVTLPDSDNHLDSPCAASQTMQLMSDSSRQRLDSTAVTFVRKAMQDAGVKNGDSVVLIGASQGGLVAASLASGLKGTYDFTHVVTASAPIANHEIPGTTFVTSVEMEGDIMPNLDGAQNPVRESWLTVQGTATNEAGATDTSTPVAGTGSKLERPHGMNYQRAAWENAVQAGSPAVEEHEEHFKQATSGKLVSTMYYQGRLQ